MRLFLLALVLLAATGCRESIVADPLVPPVEPPQADVSPLYLKGVGETLAVGSQIKLWCQRHVEGVYYTWEFLGSGGVAAVVDPNTPRWMNVWALRPGEVDVDVVVYNADNVVVGRATRTFRIVE